MKLTAFQEYVRDEEIEADMLLPFAKSFIQTLKDDFNDEYQDLKSEVVGSIDMSDNFEYAIEFNDSAYIKEMDDQIVLRVNELINTTQEEIEDIRIANQIDDEDARGDYLYELEKQRRVDEGTWR